MNGLHFVVDLNTMELLGVEDEFSVERPEGTMGEYVPALVPGQELRADLQALDVVQPEGASFVLDGHGLAWQRWSMRLGFNHREGLVIHALGYEDGGRVRPVAHRMSFAEMVVPYRDPTTDHYRRTAFDIGEWGLGFMTTSLELGCDCLGEIAYLDAVLHDSKGEPYTIANAICVHEEDDGVLWKHVDPVAGAEVRRSRRLVVSFHATVANYEYLVYWRFYQDGNVECEVRATGIMVTSQFPAGEQPPYGTLVDRRTYAPTHQHFIVARLDLDVDGEENTVVATESEALPIGPENPHGLALVQRDTPLRTESEGRQDYQWRTQRAWKVVNPARTNGLGTPVAYKLVPGGAIPAMLDPGSPVIQRAGALQHTLWVTPYDPEERWPCGEFPVQSGQDAGLPAWTARDRPIATPTSCSGTCSASTTSRARRSGPSCRSTGCPSGSSRPASSTATRPSTWRRRATGTATPRPWRRRPAPDRAPRARGAGAQGPCADARRRARGRATGAVRGTLKPSARTASSTSRSWSGPVVWSTSWMAVSRTWRSTPSRRCEHLDHVGPAIGHEPQEPGERPRTVGDDGGEHDAGARRPSPPAGCTRQGARRRRCRPRAPRTTSPSSGGVTSPCRRAATPTAPAPSTTSFERSRSSTMACATWSSDTVTTSSTQRSTSGSVRSPGRFTAIPSQIVFAERAPIGRWAAIEAG